MKTNPKKSGFTKEMIAILGKDYGESAEIMKQVEDLLKEKAATLYGDLIYTIAHLRFSENQARHHWEKVLQHKLEMARRLDRNVGVRVALLDYFTNMHRKIENPKIIELDVFEKAMLTAVTDGLTGLYNHRFFQDRLEEEVERCVRYAGTLSLLMLDLDDFKIYNDTNGHIAGDVLLVEVSKLIRRTVRKVDTVARYGGEEFSVVLPSTSKKGAMIIARRIVARIADNHFPNQIVMPGGRVTISCGVATFPDDAKDKAMLIDMADKMLYKAKRNGKNRARGIED
ncbi:MAG: GGDEF domain-containing protein [Candidatus Edwardsbacteria bacterium]|nr:GGDEF domain-containing protein [Candidatus Edwardsbacteria bacterium]